MKMRKHLNMCLEYSIVRAVIKYCKGHKGEQQVHANGLCDFQEAVRGLAACNDFVKQEEHVTTIERWDGEDVHKGKHEGDECGEFPKTLPIPCRGE